jgi:S1-C subfamily serine protease
MRNLTATICLTIAVLLGVMGCSATGVVHQLVRQQDLDSWVGMPVEALDTHSLFITVPIFKTYSASGIEIRNYANGNCNNIFYIRDGKVLEYAPTGRCYTNDSVRPQSRYNFVSRKTQPTVTARKPSSPNLSRKLNPNKVVSASSGSGFAVSSDGHVITNYHVINGCKNVKIHHKGKSIPATVVSFDPNNDLALLKGDFRPSTVLALSTNSPELLQDVYVAGYPFGRKVSTGVKVTKGIISSLTGIGNNFSNIQIDAALQPGNSGGPILDDKGNVVGVAVARLDKIKTLKKLGSLPENTNFGIKTSVVRTILESSNVSSPNPSRSSISKSKLGKMISDGTYYLSCWMTTAQIEKMRSKKVIFQNLN